MEQPKNVGGRPPKPDDEKLVQRSIRLLPSQWAEWDLLQGVEWLRPTLDKLAKKRKAQRKVK